MELFAEVSHRWLCTTKTKTTKKTDILECQNFSDFGRGNITVVRALELDHKAHIYINNSRANDEHKHLRKDGY